MVNNKNMDEIKKQNLIQNLIDSGCNKVFIDEFLLLCQKNKIQNAQRLLLKYKKELLTILYDNQKKIDCLDYLIFNLKQQ